MLGNPLLDHVAVGVRKIDQAMDWAAQAAGGREVARFTEGSWRGAQAAFAGGIRLEALEPIDAPEDDFLVRFLEHSGEGPHHLTFKVPDIEARIARLRSVGIEPVKINLSNPGWRECFLHPRLGLGTVIQLAQPSGVWSAEQELGAPAAELITAELLGAELRVSDLGIAGTVFGDALKGTAHDVDGGVAYTWPGSGTLVVRPAEGRGYVEAVVFRILRLPPGEAMPGREAMLYNGPTRVLSIDAAEPWPAPLRDRDSAAQAVG
jgi:catechol 2,3-dioxygenase-like lactoylglutathione lyase family enzyme